MSASRTCRKKGFTILELLIVIAIIAVLMTAGLGVAFYLIQKAKRTSALAVCTELEQGIESYLGDNEQFPLGLSKDATISSNSPEGLVLLRVLLNEESTDPKLNSRRKSYLDIKQGNNEIDGLIYDDSLVLQGLFDPWGGDYQIRLDGGYDGEVEVLPKGASSAKRIKRSVAVWSNGKDPDDPSDDVTTW